MPKDSNAFQQWWCLILDRFNLFNPLETAPLRSIMLHDTAMILETWRLQHLVDEALKRSKWHLIFADLRFSRSSTRSLEDSNLIISNCQVQCSNLCGFRFVSGTVWQPRVCQAGTPRIPVSIRVRAKRLETSTSAVCQTQQTASAYPEPS